MSKIFYPTSERLKFLLDSIHNREVALPDFQRDFVWEPRETEELIESICQNFPAGSLLRIKNSSSFYFAPREFAGAPVLDGRDPSYLILDGQQRLTSLYHAFYGCGNHRYLVDLQGVIGGKDLDDCVFYVRKSEADRHYGSLEQQATSLVFPFEILFGSTGGFDEWLDSVLELRQETGDERKALKQKLREARKAWLQTVEEYEFPMVTLAEDTCATAVCTIFETLNRTGVKLSVFDLLAARFWPEEVRLRDLWEQANTSHPIIADFEVDPYYILQAVSIFTARAAPSCKRGDVLDMKVEQIRTGWQPVVQGLAEMLNILRDDCGVVLPQWLPYNTILVPGAAALAFVQGLTGPAVASARQKIKRWFWCSVFGQAYENAPNSQSAKDYTELCEWISNGGPQPETVAQFTFDTSMLRTTTYRQRALYRGVLALVLRSHARDLHTGDRITASMILEKKIDDHHVFPQAYLAENRPDVGSTLRDCVLNRTLIEKAADVRIGKRAPIDYLREIENALGSDQLSAVLSSHLMPDSLDQAVWEAEHFEAFLEAREKLIADQVKAVTS